MHMRLISPGSGWEFTAGEQTRSGREEKGAEGGGPVHDCPCGGFWTNRRCKML